MTIINYSPKAIAVVGNTRDHKDALKAMGGRYNPWLKCGPGWIFSAKRKADVEAFVSMAPPTFTPDEFDMSLEDRMAEDAGVGQSLSPYERGNY